MKRFSFNKITKLVIVFTLLFIFNENVYSQNKKSKIFNNVNLVYKNYRPNNGWELTPGSLQLQVQYTLNGNGNDYRVIFYVNSYPRKYKFKTTGYMYNGTLYSIQKLKSMYISKYGFCDNSGINNQVVDRIQYRVSTNTGYSDDVNWNESMGGNLSQNLEQPYNTIKFNIAFTSTKDSSIEYLIKEAISNNKNTQQNNQSNQRVNGGGNVGNSNVSQPNTNSPSTRNNSQPNNKVDPLTAMNRQIAASNARDAKVAELGAQMGSQIGGIFGDLAANRQATMQREAEAAEKRRAIEEERKAKEKEAKRIENVKHNFFNTLPETQWPKSYESYPETMLFYYAVVKSANSIALSNVFNIVKRSDGSWPYLSDIKKSIVTNNGKEVELIGYFKDYSDANLHRNKLDSYARNSYLKSGFFKTRLGITNNKEPHSNNDSFNDPWGKTNSSVTQPSQKKNTEIKNKANNQESNINVEQQPETKIIRDKLYTEALFLEALPLLVKVNEEIIKGDSKNANVSIYNFWNLIRKNKIPLENTYNIFEAEFRTIENSAKISNLLLDKVDYITYKTVIIGNQNWMAENSLDIVKPDIKTRYYDKDPNNGVRYGSLYTWEYAAKGCPQGWHLPTPDEWGQLLEYVLDVSVSKATAKQVNAKLGINGSSGFNMQFTGAYLGNSDEYVEMNEAGMFWLNQESNDDDGFRIKFESRKLNVEKRPKSNAYPVRCIED